MQNATSIKSRPTNPNRIEEQRFDDEASSALQKLAIKTSNDQYRAVKSDGNARLFSSEVHAGIGSTGTNDFIAGVPGSEISSTITFENDIRVSGLIFKETITIPTDVTVIFTDCRFFKEISVASGGFVHCIGCLFVGTSRVNNAGALLNAYIIGCSNKTGLTHVATTVIAQTT